MKVQKVKGKATVKRKLNPVSMPEIVNVFTASPHRIRAEAARIDKEFKLISQQMAYLIEQVETADHTEVAKLEREIEKLKQRDEKLMAYMDTVLSALRTRTNNSQWMKRR